MIFFPSAIAPDSYDEAFWFCFKGTQLLVNISDGVNIPHLKDPSLLAIKTDLIHYLGRIDNAHCFCTEVISDTHLSGFEFIELRSLFGSLNNDLFLIANKALQIVNWGRTHKFCGQCGSPMKRSASEYAMICPVCGLTQYPRISPAIIVAITNKGRILLARRAGSPMYSVIAGYVEAGENLEQTVQRETQEEVGLKVKNIRYFSSQPWSFSYSLMLAFTAEYESGEITPDGKEIEEAHWFTPEEIPEKIPGRLSIAHALINWFVENHSK